MSESSIHEIKLDPDVALQLRQLAEAKDMTINELVRWLIRNYLNGLNSNTIYWPGEQ